MSTLIVYSTKHGCAETCASELKDIIKNEVTMESVKKLKKVNWDDFETVLIGGSIYAGNIQSGIQKFCQKHLTQLLKKKLGLYLCCMEKGEKAESQFEKAYPQKLRDHASATGLFGGAITLEKMNALEKVIIKKVAGVNESVSNINHQAINDFAEAITK